jgi:hypothetical protein
VRFSFVTCPAEPACRDQSPPVRYVWLYVLILKSFAVYASDIYTAIALLASNRWAGEILQSDDDNAIKVPFTIGKWIFFGCIIFSFLLLAYEARKARRIIRSRDISYAFTNVMANNYYSLKSYDHFCFFSNINDSKKKKDEFAFFIFFTFKGSFLSIRNSVLPDLTRPDCDYIQDGNVFCLPMHHAKSSTLSPSTRSPVPSSSQRISENTLKAPLSKRSSFSPCSLPLSSSPVPPFSSSSLPSCTCRYSAISRATSRSTAVTRSTSGWFSLAPLV